VVCSQEASPTDHNGDVLNHSPEAMVQLDPDFSDPSRSGSRFKQSIPIGKPILAIPILVIPLTPGQSEKQQKHQSVSQVKPYEICVHASEISLETLTF
jgi:hypothetical protein